MTTDQADAINDAIGLIESGRAGEGVRLLRTLLATAGQRARPAAVVVYGSTQPPKGKGR